MTYASRFILMILACALIQTQAKSLKFNYPKFEQSDASDFIRENSYIVLNTIQVTPDVRGVNLEFACGRALYKEPFKLWSKGKTANFDTTFVINIWNQTDPGGEAFTFLLTPFDRCPPSRIGSGSGISDGMVVEFDTRKNFPEDLDDNHVGLNVNSVYSVVQESLNGRGIRISPGALAAHVRYDGENLSLFVSANVNTDPIEDPRNLVFSYGIDLSAYLLQKVYVGFSASTSNYTQLNSVMSWKFEGEEIGEDQLFTWLWITIPIVSVVIAGALVGVYWMTRSRTGEENVDIEAEIDHCAMNPRKFKVRELKRSTSNFSLRNKLGQGGFGVVFKGIWNDGAIAVKRISQKSNQGKQEFISEITTIGNLNHRNLVKLLGWCYENKEFFLVYEFMPNGSLDRYLFSEDKSSSEPGSILMWDTRLSIIKGVAQALEYLHNGCEKRILHRDVKASNVMLDSEFNAKLGDFGLARMIQQSEITHHSTKEIAGTPGYMAPEMLFSRRATVETDVYAFGVLMIEVVSGKKPAYFSKELSNIVNWIWELHGKATITDAADSRMEGVFDEKEMKNVLILGLACCHPNPRERPSMRTVMKVLMGESDPPNVPTERPVFMWPIIPSCFGVLDQSPMGSQINSLTELTGR